MTTYAIDGLADLVGAELGTSEWLLVDQERIDRFAEATGDHQWIHVDTARAAGGPYGATIAHGYLTLSLLPMLVRQACTLEGASRRVNYGLDKVRFPQPVIAGSRVRAVVTLRSVSETRGGLRLGLTCVLEIEGAEKPACVAETLTLLLI
ncbi:MaoC family dehydratase [Acrocarpospora macrocephala]|uniref:MaoC family dehydratase n=1 Tax=Acrocarpospora macrocephala TaxID=150177 RepID=A0A5M3WJH4_9ACTN|nr:MaoC family dehydratase [Acrocarpospora macrocephala]GES07193.1 MaoC family dehydratase [Acrocarpospora macrocephala]